MQNLEVCKFFSLHFRDLSLGKSAFPKSECVCKSIQAIVGLEAIITVHTFRHEEWNSESALHDSLSQCRKACTIKRKGPTHKYIEHDAKTL